jgi:DNA transformation protein and related proteins
MTVALKNLGPKSIRWLAAADIHSTEELRALGPVEAYRRVKRAGFKPSLNLLYAMAAGLRDEHWAKLSDEEKMRLELQADFKDDLAKLTNKPTRHAK